MRIVLFGATGYTGRLTAEAMVRAGLAPVLAGRHHDAVARLADRLAPLAPSRDAEPRIAIADVADPASVRALLESPSDVLVTTVGPFIDLGAAAVEAAIDAGAAYLDSTGEPPFIRRVFDEWGPRAESTGARLMTAFGYDYVPGNLAGTSLAGIPANRQGHGDLDPAVLQIDWSDADALIDLLDQRDDVAAFFCEPIIGAGGVYAPPEGYLDRVREACRERDVLFVADEVISGYGRAGAMFASTRWSLDPDVLLSAKGVTSGYVPLGAV
ncbi:MAG: aminotransferase class III-fold pyridoxal phosphate-dependent enzyme, partial [Actinomycetota bacterium]